MKNRNFTRIRRLALGVLGALIVLGANDAFAQSRSGRNDGLRRRIVKVLPEGSTAIELEGKKIYHSNGVFYREVRENFVTVRPPLGTIVSDLPSETVTVPVEDGAAYYMNHRTFYKEADGGFEVVKAPLGKTVRTLPDGYETLATRGDTKTYFYNGLAYKADAESDTYTIVGPRLRGNEGRGGATMTRTGRRDQSGFRSRAVMGRVGFRNLGFKRGRQFQRMHSRFDRGSRFERGSRFGNSFNRSENDERNERGGRFDRSVRSERSDSSDVRSRRGRRF